MVTTSSSGRASQSLAILIPVDVFEIEVIIPKTRGQKTFKTENEPTHITYTCHHNNEDVVLVFTSSVHEFK